MFSIESYDVYDGVVLDDYFSFMEDYLAPVGESCVSCHVHQVFITLTL